MAENVVRTSIRYPRQPINPRMPITSASMVVWEINSHIQSVTDIKKGIRKHKFQPALWYHKERRELLPRLVEIREMYRDFVSIRYKCYAPDGSFRQFIDTSILYVDLFTGENRIRFFDEGI